MFLLSTKSLEGRGAKLNFYTMKDIERSPPYGAIARQLKERYYSEPTQIQDLEKQKLCCISSYWPLLLLTSIHYSKGGMELGISCAVSR